MKRALSTIFLVLAVAVPVWWTLRGGAQSRQVATRDEAPSTSVHILPDRLSPAPVAASSEPAGEVKEDKPREVPPPGQDRERRAFRFVLSDGKLELEAVEDIQGDFHPRRGRAAWQPGMLCCRLLDDRQRVLAEETVPAPDHVCIVLDPNVAGADGKPQPAVLSPGGPVVFQVRLPKMESATQMKVYRLAGAQPAGFDEEPAGQLLATIPLAR